MWGNINEAPLYYYGPHSISQDPLFVDAAAGDFRLKTGSPCVGAGAGGVNMGAYPGGFLAPDYVNYYVSPDGTDASGYGTQAAPWKTIGYAARNALPWSSVNVSSGIYKEGTINPGNSFTTYKAVGRVVLTGDTNGDGAPDLSNGFYLNYLSGTRIQGFLIEKYQNVGIYGENVPSTVISSNVLSGNWSDNINLFEASNSLIESNICSNGGNGIYVSGAGLILRYNLVYGNTYSGIGAEGAENSQIYNNTIYANEGQGLTASNSSAITNNIIAKNWAESSFGGGGEIYGYNDMWGNINEAPLYYYGLHNISQDPLFIYPSTNPVNADFRLLAGSPCLGTGANGINIGYYLGAGLAVSKAADGILTVVYQKAADAGGVPVAVTVTTVSSTDSRAVLALATAPGVILSQLYDVGPDGTVFTPAAEILFKYDEAQLGGIDENLLEVYRYDDAASGWQKLPVVERNTAGNWISVKTDSLCLFGIFLPQAPAADTIPPVSNLNMGEPKFQAFELPIISPDTRISITAEDPAGDSPASGVKEIYYQTVNVKTSSQSAVTVYSSSFTLSEQGTFLIRYWSTDNANNTESPKELSLAVTPLQLDVLAAVDGLHMSGTSELAGRVESNGAVLLSGNARIAGDVSAKTIDIAGKAQVTGQNISGVSTLNAEPIELAGIAQKTSGVNNNAAIDPKYLTDGRFTVSAKAGFTLSTGTYYFKGVNLSGGCNITVSGEVDILVDGDINISGGSSLNAAGPASALNIFSNTASTLAFTGGGNLAAYIYAPYSHLKLAGNALLGGHYFVKTAEVNGAGIVQSGESLPVAPLAGVLPGPDPEFKLGAVYVHPNPAKGGKAPVFHIEVGVADTVKITIFTVSGQVAHEHVLTGAPRAIGAAYAYEYAWEGRMAGGVYYYAIEADKAGKKLKAGGGFVVSR